MIYVVVLVSVAAIVLINYTLLLRERLRILRQMTVDASTCAAALNDQIRSVQSQAENCDWDIVEEDIAEAITLSEVVCKMTASLDDDSLFRLAPDFEPFVKFTTEKTGPLIQFIQGGRK